MSLTGKGAPQARKEASVEGRPGLYFEDLATEVPIVPQYAHLGGTIDVKLNCKAERRKRLALPGLPLTKERSSSSRVARSLCQSVHNCLRLEFLPPSSSWPGKHGRGLFKMLTTSVGACFPGRCPVQACPCCAHPHQRSWSLDLVAIRSRLGLLASLIVLQKEQEWLSWARKDMQRLVDFDKAWPQSTNPWTVQGCGAANASDSA